ncbi:olfactory receptor 52N4-like [Pseudophryne corroboree]|uniref:olfactory receptor 52N4-like n=1 Tax=Pseudophryne corroboree TaxID=495146 RepID=UPI003081908A
MGSMSSSNISDSTFILVGIPGLEGLHGWISLPICSIYVITVLANVCVLLIIKTEKSLHQPMYLFLSMLLFTDLVSCNAVLPKMLLIFWFNHQEISFDGCLVQMFFVTFFSIMGSSMLLVMAYDRYVAICHPLRYSTIFTSPFIMKIGLLVALRGLLLVFPIPFLVKRLPFCQSHIIENIYCDHMTVAKLSCADIRFNVVYGLAVVVMVVGVDFVSVSVSYYIIVRTVMRLPFREARHKVWSTCVSHICVILVAYISAFFSSVYQRFGEHTTTSTQIILSNLYLILPAMLNPIIYGIKTKGIQRYVIRLLYPQRTNKQNI